MKGFSRVLSYRARLCTILTKFSFQTLAVPSVAFEPRLRGSFRNLMYSKHGGPGETRQEMMAYKVNQQSLLESWTSFNTITT